MSWHENTFYNPNALAEQLKAEAVRSPAVRLGGSVYGANEDSGEKNQYRKRSRSGTSGVQNT